MTFWLIIRTLVSGIVILYLQVLFVPKLAVAGVTPNLFLAWIVYQVWRKPATILIPIIFFLGVCYDLTMPGMLGLQTVLFILLAVGVDEFHRPLERDSYITMGITLGLACIAYSLAIYMVYGIQAGFTVNLFLNMLGMTLYNLVFSAAVSAVFIFISNLRLDFRHG
jgi:rod shape-determining protein MreD